ncbi:polysaccharide deacetylase family protein [Paracoccus tegillarcae]|uniref:Chitooligosaccharide deacetylase n=1 Tax=Paracoccus tegillarcae TaxID=1529068 RepID=A0A2K9EZQ4_9RHOB|nr:polysaccharide deacetylase family protein [Paracoccus tegillarcae]AUH34794.1 hypothetical protein CUV01_16655 [Paracoccus tegillarcae]
MGRAKEIIKSAVFGATALPPVYQTLRRRALRSDPISILCFHTLGADDDQMDAYTVFPEARFRELIDLLRPDYDFVTLDDALDGPGTGRPQLVLTFDDGDVGLYTRLLPILRAEALPVLAYIATGQIAAQSPYWFDRIVNALQGPGERQIDLTSQGLGRWTIGPQHGPVRCARIAKILELMKSVPPDARPKVVEDILAQAAPITPPAYPLAPMSLDQLREFADCEHVTVGAHSHCHNVLDQIPLEQAADSIARSRALLQEWTGQDVRHFCYPNGNHTAALHQEIMRQGFASATVLDNHLTPRDQNRAELSRINVGRFANFQRLRLRLAGI